MAATPLLGLVGGPASVAGSTVASTPAKSVLAGLAVKKGVDALGSSLSSVDAMSGTGGASPPPPTPDAPSVQEAGKEQLVARGRAATVLAGGGRGLEDIPYRGARRVLMGR